MSEKSKSEKYLQNKDGVPQVSALMAQSVSEYRRDSLSKEVDKGLFKDGSGPTIKDGGMTANGLVSSSIGGMKKQAQLTSSSGYGASGGSADSVKQAPEVYSPLWLNSNLSLPRDRATINAWCRSFFALNPIIQNAISLHSTYPISKLNIKSYNKEVEKFFNDMIEEIDLMNICVQVAQEFWLLGESFIYADYDKNAGKWSRLLIQNPDYMVVSRTVAADEPVITMKPDENLKRIVFSNKPRDVEQRKQLNQYIIDCVKRGDNIPIENFHISHIARKISPYEIRGTGLPVAVFRQLVLFDLLRESKFAQASNMINPITVVKIGSSDFKPTHADLESWRSTFEAAQHDKDFKIFTHEGVAIERIGSSGGIYDISGDINQLIKEIYTGLQVPSVVIEGGSDISYANGGIALDVLRQRYMQFRNMMASWLRRKIFAPISKIQGFYEYKNGEKQLIVPEIDWNHMSLFDTSDYVNQLVSLTQGEGAQKRASLHTLYRSLGLDSETENRNIRKEAIQAAISKKEVAALDTLSLNELRSLDDDDEIPEPKEAVPGAGGMGAVPGEAPGGMPDLGLGGGMPDLGMPPPGGPSPGIPPA
jgi:hypothetical protein